MNKVAINIFLLTSLVTVLTIGCTTVNSTKMDASAPMDDDKPTIYTKGERELKEMGILKYGIWEGYEIIGENTKYAKEEDKSPQTEEEIVAEITADFLKNREFFLGEPEEAYAKYAKQIAECEKYAQILNRFVSENKNRNRPILELESVHHPDSGYTVFHFVEFEADDSYLSFIYDKDGKCIGYVHSGFFKF